MQHILAASSVNTDCLSREIMNHVASSNFNYLFMNSNFGNKIWHTANYQWPGHKYGKILPNKHQAGHCTQITLKIEHTHFDKAML